MMETSRANLQAEGGREEPQPRACERWAVLERGVGRRVDEAACGVDFFVLKAAGVRPRPPSRFLSGAKCALH